MTAAGLYVDGRSMLVGRSDNRKDTLIPQAERLLPLAEGRRPTAIVCVTDFAARCVYPLAKRHGLRLPEDLSITGFDDLSDDDALSPTLSSVGVPYEEIGALAARLALGLASPGDDHPVLPVEFHRRESIAPPRP